MAQDALTRGADSVCTLNFNRSLQNYQFACDPRIRSESWIL